MRKGIHYDPIEITPELLLRIAPYKSRNLFCNRKILLLNLVFDEHLKSRARSEVSELFGAFFLTKFLQIIARSLFFVFS
jgi:hypothetical protein